MKFDVIIGNPPYQIKVGESKTEPLWDKFVELSLNSLKDDGYLALIHPNGWRDVYGQFDFIRDKILDHQIQYLEMHNVKDSKKNFKGIQIMYDWYVLKKAKPTKKTTVKFQDGSFLKYNLKEMPFIPSGNVDLFKQLLASDDDERVNIMWDSKYHHQKPHMSKVENDEFKYPCVYTIKSGDIVNFWYSNINKGHFGTPKFIWGNGVCSSIGNVIDYGGEYGLTEFAYCIIDTPENLNHLKQTFDSEKFQNLMKTAPNRNNNYNRKVISLFKKDFWKYFI